MKRSRAWFLGANLQYGITEYPKIQLRRNVLFRFEDLLGELGRATGGMWDIIEKRFLTRCLADYFSLPFSAAYIGSTIGLFLGCSLLSCTEFIYFFTWRFVKLLLQQQKAPAPVQLSLPVA